MRLEARRRGRTGSSPLTGAASVSSARMVLTSVLQQLRAAPAASDKTASFPARPWTAAVRQSAWILMGMPLPAASAAKHSCATTTEVKILHWGPSHVQMTTPPAAYLLTQDHWIRTLSAAHGGPAMSSRRRQREYARYGSPAAPHLRRQRTTGPQRAHAPEAPRARS